MFCTTCIYVIGLVQSFPPTLHGFILVHLSSKDAQNAENAINNAESTQNAKNAKNTK
jgi:hypothetical protein